MLNKDKILTGLKVTLLVYFDRCKNKLKWELRWLMKA